LEPDEFAMLVTALGRNASDDEINDWVARRCTGKQVNYVQFRQFISEYMPDSPTTKDLEDAWSAFATFDRESGIFSHAVTDVQYIEVAQLRYILAEFGAKLSTSEIDKLLANLGHTEGRVSKEGFLDFLTKHPDGFVGAGGAVRDSEASTEPESSGG
jgi:Ca2+-binding EF-hand superfamily protein|tara:strand:+ start:346 stop:816 length:471 start_codon:yes stop_codon:yes gene_type:complete